MSQRTERIHKAIQAQTHGPEYSLYPQVSKVGKGAKRSTYSTDLLVSACAHASSKKPR
jgi:hypothetical protein